VTIKYLAVVGVLVKALIREIMGGNKDNLRYKDNTCINRTKDENIIGGKVLVMKVIVSILE
jgi:hypothetical protein